MRKRIIIKESALEALKRVEEYKTGVLGSSAN